MATVDDDNDDDMLEADLNLLNVPGGNALSLAGHATRECVRVNVAALANAGAARGLTDRSNLFAIVDLFIGRLYVTSVEIGIFSRVVIANYFRYL